MNKLKAKSFRRWMNAKLNLLNLNSDKRKAAAFVCQKLTLWSSLDLSITFSKWRNQFKL